MKSNGDVSLKNYDDILLLQQRLMVLLSNTQQLWKYWPASKIF